MYQSFHLETISFKPAPILQRSGKERINKTLSLDLMLHPTNLLKIRVAASVRSQITQCASILTLVFNTGGQIALS